MKVFPDLGKMLAKEYNPRKKDALKRVVESIVTFVSYEYYATRSDGLEVIEDFVQALLKDDCEINVDLLLDLYHKEMDDALEDAKNEVNRLSR